jgi:hypothetical protein
MMASLGIISKPGQTPEVVIKVRAIGIKPLLSIQAKTRVPLRWSGRSAPACCGGQPFDG